MNSRRSNLHNPLTHSRVFLIYRRKDTVIYRERRRNGEGYIFLADALLTKRRKGYRNNYIKKQSKDKDYNNAFNINTVDACPFDVCKENVIELQFSTLDLIRKKKEWDE